MPESSQNSYKPIPFDQRPSQNVGVMEYMKNRVSIWLLPAITYGAGWLAGSTQKYDTPSQTKNQSILSKAVAATSQGHKGALWASLAGKIGFVGSAFLLWRQDEQKRLQVKDVLQEAKDILSYNQTNETLEKDIALNEKMIAFERKKQGKLEEKLKPSYMERLELEEAPSSESKSFER